MRKCVKISEPRWLLFLMVLLTVLIPNLVMAQEDSTTAVSDTSKVYFINRQIVKTTGTNVLHNQNILINSDTNLLRLVPYASIQQMSKGNLPGVYVKEPNGEPGTDQYLFVQGINGPLLSPKHLYEQQAAVYLNGIPLMRDHPFAYEIQKTDYSRIGTGTNNLAIFNVNNIKSVEVIKDPVKLAALGPIAANGAIWITTDNAEGRTSGSINLYSGFVPAPRISPVNAAYEMAFRKPFYNRYASVEDMINIPGYLKDSTNTDYYGPANWDESYYKPTFTYGADASLTGGSNRANFRLFLSSIRDANSADEAGFERHNASFYVNVAPVQWLNFHSMISYNRIDRARNRNITDRLAEQRYMPDLATPLTPGKTLYDSYLREFRKTVDLNINHSLQAYFGATAKFKTVLFNSSLMVDYADINRDAFWPETFLEKNNFVSHYLGINQRVVFTNSLSNDFKISDKQNLKVTARQSFNSDFSRYKYAIGYNGPNDFIKINLFHTNSTEQNYISYYFPNSITTALSSFSGEFDYTVEDILRISAVLRRDGSSAKDAGNRWFTGYSAGFDYNVSRHAGLKNTSIGIFGGYAKAGKTMADDRFSGGSVYTSYVGWENEPVLGTYLGIPALARPYQFGWVGNVLPWAFYEKLNIGARFGLFENALQLGVEYYNRNDKNGVLLVPTPAEWGYQGQYKPGMTVNNSGFDFSFNASIINNTAGNFAWTLNGNISVNSNQLKQLPGNLDEIVMGNAKLKVGERIDAYWVFKNEGVYDSDSEVPNGSNGKLTYNGISFKKGDARWADLNGDFDVTNEDKILTGNYMPKCFGGFGTNLSYGKFSLDAQFTLALGQSFLNQYAASRLDFVNSDVSRTLSAVKEITFWQKGEDLSAYPQYNPWSSVTPYQLYQDLFVQEASYVKLRSATVTYRLPSVIKYSKLMQAYLSGYNLFTFSKFKGTDPELLNYQGIYDGKVLPMVRSFVLGVKIDF